jgi:hypothetical protein
MTTQKDAGCDFATSDCSSARNQFFRKLDEKIAKVTADWSEWQHRTASAGIDGRSANKTARPPINDGSVDI